VTAIGARAYYLIYRSAGSEKKAFLWIGDAATMSLADRVTVLEQRTDCAVKVQIRSRSGSARSGSSGSARR
jgi:hypothetical protein